MILAAAENGQELLFVWFRRLEQLGAFEDLDVARPAGRGATRKRDGREVLVTDIDQVPALGRIDELSAPDGIRKKFDTRHQLAPA
jgi:hypothetical protein